MPIGAFLCKDSCDVLEPGDHGSTFGGNALATAAANATVRFMVENDVPANANKAGAYFKGKLDDYKVANPDTVVDVRGMGLLLALQFSDTISAKVVAACNEEGLLLNPVRPDAIRFMPPLTITESDVDEAMEKLGRGITKALVS